jgi:hypothetical protein
MQLFKFKYSNIMYSWYWHKLAQIQKRARDMFEQSERSELCENYYTNWSDLTNPQMKIFFWQQIVSLTGLTTIFRFLYYKYHSLLWINVEYFKKGTDDFSNSTYMVLLRLTNFGCPLLTQIENWIDYFQTLNNHFKLGVSLREKGLRTP